MNKPFKFKQFSIKQDKCAMKVGTDSVLLGAWTSIVNHPDTILDIGSGTGILALMLAQRSSAETIEALEINEDAYEQCVENFEASPWADRLFCYHAGLDEFVEELEELYQLIVCNPPFYSETVSSGSTARDTARQNKALPFTELAEGVSHLLAPEGLFAIIIPYKEEAEFVKIASNFALYPTRILRVRGNRSSEVKRSLIELRRQPVALREEALTIEEKRHVYTPEYRNLTKDFYLKM